MMHIPQEQQEINIVTRSPADQNQQVIRSPVRPIILGILDDWRLVMRGGDDCSVQVGDVFRVVWARVPVLDFPSGTFLGRMTMEKGRCRVIEVHEQFSIMQSIVDSELTPWLVMNPDIPPVAVGDEMEQLA